MRKTLVALFVFVALTIAAFTATAATNQITLAGTADTALTFTSTGSGNWTLAFTPDPLSGSAFGTGTLTSSGPYSITQGAVTITGTEVTSTNWSISQSGNLGFSYGTSGSLLSGNLQLIDLSQTSQTGTFNDAIAANLTLTGGSLESLLGNNAVLSITIDFASNTSLAGLLNGQQLTAGISSGELYQAPEPVSMVLVGSGLILLGGLVRRRRTNR